ncbi:MAG: TonB-dependent receptor [Bacteroidales bacterium]|nr:TonB-dependent receptor [Bacteroidales bacterium]
MKRKLFLLSVLLAGILYVSGQQITGNVTDETDSPLPGVNVIIKGTTTGTITDADGNYAIEVPDAESELVFSYVGYLTETIQVGDKSVIDMQLISDLAELEEVIVVGYGSIRRKDITTAISTIDMNNSDKQSPAILLHNIEGKAAGVQVVSPSGKPGSGLSVSIRGNTSLQASNEPLYVVDGVPLVKTYDKNNNRLPGIQDVGFLNPADIESITILKDASAAAIYGASGANGVVLITTRKGAANQTKVRFQTFTGFSTFWKKIDVLDRDQYLDLMTELGYDDPNTENTDWQDEAFGRGVDNNYQLSFSGGSEKTQYYFSLGYQKQKGVVAPASFDRYSARLNVTNKTTKWLNLTSNLSFTKSKSRDITDNAGVARGGTILSALTTPPTIGIYNPDGTYTSNPNKGGWENPIANAYAAQQGSNDYHFLGNMTADIYLLKGLTFRSNLGGDFQYNQWDYFLDPFSTDWGRTNEGIGQTRSWDNFIWLFENTLNYNLNFGNHSVTAMAGITAQESKFHYSYMQGSHFQDDYIPTLNAATVRDAINTDIQEWAKNSYLARISYDYKKKYLISSNFRIDGSSRFGKNYNVGYFPSVSAGWRISSESFMEDIKKINELKLRVGWGKTGNDEGIGNYSSYGLYDPSVSGYNFRKLANEDLKWEATTQTNIGLDLATLNSRIVFNIDAYKKETNDLLVNVKLPPTSGFDIQTLNVGSIENKGIEFVLATKNFVGDFNWQTDFNISFNRNEVTSLGEATDEISYGSIYERGDAIKVVVGRPLGSFYGYVYDGVDPETGDVIYHNFDTIDAINPAFDRVFIGDAQPDFIYGLTNTFSYKKFELTIFLQGVQGNQMFNASRIELESMNDSKNQSTDVLNRWMAPGDVTNIPRADQGNTYNTAISTRFVEDASYMRIKTVTLSYTFSGPWWSKIGIQNLGLYMTGQNLWTFTKYKGFDPEVSQYGGSGPSIGIDYGTYPQYRTIIFGLNVEF